VTKRLLAAAYQLTRRGWFVFPLQPKGKRPIKLTFRASRAGYLADYVCCV
jgi:hypothetical protein